MAKKEPKPSTEWEIMLKELDKVAEAHKKKLKDKKAEPLGRMDSI